ncbi:ribokinase [Calorimonas adulescens]|uniref:Ribokinase n=1 Tax=Calorimonas adulescens TaxID=2606906 RepID=A0A5D8Q929_9THEO|nr:ribokinase [Calorimonas adulescens]TZE80286.1 ribokinase [Calorimonas adulescens]
MKAIAIGSINMDFTMSVDHLPVKGETIAAKSFKESAGGKGANQAVALSRLGADVMMIGAVGRDGMGSILMNSLKRDGIETKGIKEVDAPTGNAFITVDVDGNNTIVVYPGANYELDIGWVEAFKEDIRASDFVILQMEIPIDTVVGSIELANRLGTNVILNPAPAKALPDHIYRMIDMIIPNETEIALLTGIEDVKQGARRLLEKGVKRVVVTLGEKGCLYVDAERELMMEGNKVRAVDSTAAGDAFTAGLAISFGRGDDLKSALKFANAVGALTVTRVGAQDSLPTYKEVEMFLRRQEK